MLVQLKNYKLLLGSKSLFEMGVGEVGSRLLEKQKSGFIQYRSLYWQSCEVPSKIITKILASNGSTCPWFL
jgi:hypothetical protein